jgi:hypothetical protein
MDIILGLQQHLYRGSKRLCAPDDDYSTKNSVYSNIPHTIDDLKMAHHRIHLECGLCYTEHSLREHSLACH